MILDFAAPMRQVYKSWDGNIRHITWSAAIFTLFSLLYNGLYFIVDTVTVAGDVLMPLPSSGTVAIGSGIEVMDNFVVARKTGILRKT